MLEIRKRESFNKVTKYNRLNTEDDIDAAPTLNNYSIENKLKEAKKSHKLHYCKFILCTYYFRPYSNVNL